MSLVGLKVFSTEENDGRSFNERTYSLLPIFPKSYGSEISNILSKGKTSVPFLTNAAVGIECGSTNDRALTPVNGDIIYIDLYRLPMCNENFGYYIHSLAVNPALGATFLQALSSEPIIHTLCEMIQESQTTYALATAKSFTLELPDILKAFYQANHFDSQSGRYETYSFPTICVTVYDGLIEIKDNIPYLVNEGDLDINFYYRNLDFYSFNFKYVDGETAINSYAKEIETFFTLLNSSNRYLQKSEETSTRDTSYDHNLFAYSGETYELTTLGALVLGKALGQKDIVADVLGRIYTIPVFDPRVCTTEITRTYFKYLDSLSFSSAYYTDYRADIDILDNDYNHTENYINYGYLTTESSRPYFMSILKYTRSTYFQRSPNKLETPVCRVNYFNNLADRINMLRELAVLSFPTETVCYSQLMSGGNVQGVLNKPLYVVVDKNKELKFFTYTIAKLLNGQSDTECQEFIKDFNRKRSLISCEVTGEAMQSDLVQFMGFDGDKPIIKYRGVGDALIGIPIEMNTVIAYVDLRFLKQLLTQELITGEDYYVDLAPFTEVEYGTDIIKNDQDCNWVLPTDWRRIQETHMLNYNDTFTTLEDNICMYDIVTNTAKVTYTNTGELSFVYPEVLIQNTKDYTPEKALAINPLAFYGYDPVMNIREGLKLEGLTIDNKMKVNSFNNEEVSCLSKDIDNLGLKPINHYILAKDIFADDILIPMAGTYCKLGKCLPEHKAFEFMPSREILLDPTINLSRNRRYL